MKTPLQVQKRDKNTRTKQLLKAGAIPACIYGKGMDTISIQVDGIELGHALSSSSHKLEIALEEKTFLVGIGEVQRAPVGRQIHHVSFHALNKNESATLQAEIRLTGQAHGQKEGGQVDHFLHQVTVRGLPHQLPDVIGVSIEKLNLGDSISVADLVDDYSFEFAAEDLEKVIVRCSHPKVLDLGESAEPPPQEEIAPEPAASEEGETHPVEEAA